MEQVIREFIRQYTRENPSWFTYQRGSTTKFLTHQQMVDHIRMMFEGAYFDDGMLADTISDCMVVVREMESDGDKQMSADEDTPQMRVFAQLSEHLLNYANVLTNEELAEVLMDLTAKVLSDGGDTPADIFKWMSNRVGLSVAENIR